MSFYFFDSLIGGGTTFWTSSIEFFSNCMGDMYAASALAAELYMYIQVGDMELDFFILLPSGCFILPVHHKNSVVVKRESE